MAATKKTTATAPKEPAAEAATTTTPTATVKSSPSVTLPDGWKVWKDEPGAVAAQKWNGAAAVEVHAENLKDLAARAAEYDAHIAGKVAS